MMLRFLYFMEVWKDVVGYENLYQVSNLGNVKSMPKSWITGKGATVSHNGIILKQSLKSKNVKYYVVTLNNPIKQIYVHQLVAMAFLNHIPNGKKIVVDHIDNNSLNNNLNNLQIISARENVSKDIKNKTSKYTGVHYCKRERKYVATIYIDKKNKTLGYFKNEEEAYEKYKNELDKINL